MIAVTSIGLNRIERQQYCIRTWLDRGFKVIAVQCPGETESLISLFPGVEFKEYPLPDTNMFVKNTPTIQSMCQQAIYENDRVLLINSDISIKDNSHVFKEEWKEQEKTLLIGIRYDAEPGSKRRKKQAWGIDVFCLTPEMALTVPDIGFRIGCPGWDFWIIYHFHLLGYKIYSTNSKLFHEKHLRGWSTKDQATYRQMIAMNYGHSSTLFLPNLIKELTNR